jgi:hypothetical protein
LIDLGAYRLSRRREKLHTSPAAARDHQSAIGPNEIPTASTTNARNQPPAD